MTEHLPADGLDLDALRARTDLDAWTREVVAWHFDPATGCPFWLDFAEGAVILRRGLQGRLLGRTRRPLQQEQDYRLTLWTEGAFIDVFLDDEWILASHTETRRVGAFGFVVCGGAARFREATVQTIGEA